GYPKFPKPVLSYEEFPKSSNLGLSYEENLNKATHANIQLNTSHIQITINDSKVYESLRMLAVGVVLLWVDISRIKLLGSRHFPTYSPSEADPLIQALRDGHSNHLTIILIVPEASMFLGEAETEMRKMGCRLIPRIAMGEAAIAFLYRDRSISETLLTNAPLDLSTKQSYQDVIKPTNKSLALDFTLLIHEK
ncbi:unnamed protein product, partial [Meganyctiphanes norvegica]